MKNPFDRPMYYTVTDGNLVKLIERWEISGQEIVLFGLYKPYFESLVNEMIQNDDPRDFARIVDLSLIISVKKEPSQYIFSFIRNNQKIHTSMVDRAAFDRYLRVDGYLGFYS